MYRISLAMELTLVMMEHRGKVQAISVRYYLFTSISYLFTTIYFIYKFYLLTSSI